MTSNSLKVSRAPASNSSRWAVYYKDKQCNTVNLLLMILLGVPGIGI